MKPNNLEIIYALKNNPTKQAAADTLGISRSTLYEYMASDSFKSDLETYNAGRDDTLSEIIKQNETNALNALGEIVQGGLFTSDADRIEAAKVILGYKRPYRPQTGV